MSIEGIPAGWELVRFDYANKGESFLNGTGEIILHIYDTPTPRMRLIIRKIEKPKRYRQFASAAEADCMWNEVLKLAYPAAGSEDSRYRINSITRDGATIALQFFDYRKAFEMFVCIDGTPFGVEVTE